MHADRDNESDESECGEGVSGCGTLDDDLGSFFLIHKMHGDMVMHELCSDIQDDLAGNMDGIDAITIKVWNLASSACFKALRVAYRPCP